MLFHFKFDAPFPINAKRNGAWFQTTINFNFMQILYIYILYFMKFDTPRIFVVLTRLHTRVLVSDPRWQRLSRGWGPEGRKWPRWGAWYTGSRGRGHEDWGWGPRCWDEVVIVAGFMWSKRKQSGEAMMFGRSEGRLGIQGMRTEVKEIES